MPFLIFCIVFDVINNITVIAPFLIPSLLLLIILCVLFLCTLVLLIILLLYAQIHNTSLSPGTVVR